MLKLLKNFFSKPNKTDIKEFSETEYQQHYNLKTIGLENILGPMHQVVGHAIIPFSVGGSVDMYYFRNHIQGTGFATMELIEPDGSGPKENKLGTYELVAFTKYNYEDTENNTTPFILIERFFCGVFTTLGSYGRDAILNPNETCEIPNDEDEENTCLVFTKYEPDGTKFKIGKKEHHLLLCIQVHRSEMEFARQEGVEALLMKLKENNYYPYSDLDRNSVV